MTDLVARVARLGTLVLVLVALVVTLLACGCGWGGCRGRRRAERA